MESEVYRVLCLKITEHNMLDDSIVVECECGTKLWMHPSSNEAFPGKVLNPTCEDCILEIRKKDESDLVFHPPPRRQLEALKKSIDEQEKKK
jgi:hypothetical protein